MQHTNTSSMSCASTMSLLYRDLGARGSARQTSKMDKVEIGRPLFSQTGRLLNPNLGRQTGPRTHTQTHRQKNGSAGQTYRVARALFSRWRLISEASLPVFQRGWGRTVVNSTVAARPPPSTPAREISIDSFLPRWLPEHIQIFCCMCTLTIQ